MSLLSETNHWTVSANSVYFNGVALSPLDEAILDTGTSLILFPSATFYDFLDQLTTIKSCYETDLGSIWCDDCTSEDGFPELEI